VSPTLKKCYKFEWLIYSIVGPKPIGFCFWIECCLNMLYYELTKKLLKISIFSQTLSFVMLQGAEIELEKIFSFIIHFLLCESKIWAYEDF
jgi:hypothetical protein